MHLTPFPFLRSLVKRVQDGTTSSGALNPTKVINGVKDNVTSKSKSFSNMFDADTAANINETLGNPFSLSSIRNGFVETAKHLTNPESVLKDFTAGIKEFEDYKSIGGLFNIAMNVPDIMYNISPDRPDLEDMGPIQNITSRLGSLLYNINANPMRGNLLGSLPAYMLTSSAVQGLANLGGSFVDKMLGFKPPKINTSSVNNAASNINQIPPEMYQEYINKLQTNMANK